MTLDWLWQIMGFVQFGEIIVVLANYLGMIGELHGGKKP